MARCVILRFAGGVVVGCSPPDTESTSLHGSFFEVYLQKEDSSKILAMYRWTGMKILADVEPHSGASRGELPCKRVLSWNSMTAAKLNRQSTLVIEGDAVRGLDVLHSPVCLGGAVFLCVIYLDILTDPMVVRLESLDPGGSK